MGQSIANTIQQWRGLVKERLELEKLAKKIKEGPEAELRAQILMYLDANNMTGVKVEGGTISKTSKKHLEAEDMEKFLSVMLDMMLQAKTEGRPLVEGVLLQRTLLKSGITDWVKERLGVNDDPTDDQFNAVAAELGVKRISENDITFRTR